MFGGAVIPAADIVAVLFVEFPDIESLTVQCFDKGRVLNDQQELSGGFAQCHSQARLIQFCKSIAFIVGEIRVIRGIQENKVVFIIARKMKI